MNVDLNYLFVIKDLIVNNSESHGLRIPNTAQETGFLTVKWFYISLRSGVHGSLHVLDLQM